MGSKNKLKRLQENETFHNVYQPTREELLNNSYDKKGHWREKVFNNNNPIVLELGCGKGEYTVSLAERNPNINYIGIDIKGARFWRGAKTAIEENLYNVAFIRTQIELVEYVFGENEVDEIWITFPDPQIKYKRTKHRMTNLAFIERYRKILKAKYWMGLNNYKPVVLENLQEDLNTVEDELLHRDLVKNSLTVIKDEKQNIPLSNLDFKEIAYVKLGDDNGDDFLKMLKNYTKVDEVSDTKLDGLLKKLKNYKKL